jgi:hypothetical protein
MWLVEACVGRQVLIGYDHDRTGEEKGQGLGAAFAAVGIFPKRLRSEIATDWNEHLQRVGRDRMAADVRTAILGQQVAHALVPVGGRVGDLNGQWWGIVTAAHPADDLFPCGWVELATTEGGYVQADMRTLMTTTGTPVVPPGSRWHTPEEIFAIAKEDPEDG